MKCKDLETNAIAYLDGKLPPAQQEAMERHLGVCSACRERVEGFTQVMGLLGEWESIQPSPFFQTRLAARLEEEAASRGWWSRLAGWQQWASPARPERSRRERTRSGSKPFASSLVAIVFAVVVTVAVVLVRYSPTPVPVSQPAAPAVTVAANAGDEMALYQELPLLEDWEVLRNFEVLQELNNTKPVLQ